MSERMEKTVPAAIHDPEAFEGVDALEAQIELRQTDKAFRRLRAEYVEEMIGCDVLERDARDTCHLAIKVLDGVRQKLLHIARHQ